MNPERPVAIDLSLEAARRAHELFGLLSCSADAACLPFKTNSFDVVLCSEVIEHLERPFAAIGELLRVCRHYLLITTEVVGSSPLHRLAMLKTRQIGEPHYDRNIWLLEDFEKMFGEDIVAIPQFFASSDRNDPESSEVARRKLLEMVPLEKPSRSTVGLVILIRKDRSLPLPPPSYRRDEESIILLFAGPLSLPRSEPQTWSADDLDKLVVKDQPTGVGTLDLSGIDRASSPTGNDKRSLPHTEQLSRLFKEANRANVVTYPFWRVLRRTLRSWG